MKSVKIFFSIVLAIFISTGLTAQTQSKDQSTKTVAIKVNGNCEMCKDRIEKAVKTAGATSSYWDAKTQMLKVSYDPSKTTSDDLEKKIAAAGHDTHKFKAEDKVYNALPGCCKYEREKK